VRLSSLRKFSADPLLAAQATRMTEDQRAHPVIAALRRRREEGSRPGARTDSRRIALVIEGGAMRGVVSAGMTAAIEQLGFTDCFDEVHGASAGAFAAAFLLAGQAAYLTGLYPHGFGNPVFAGAGSLLRGRPVFDLDYVVHEVWRNQRPLRTNRILTSGIELHLTATDVDTTEPVDLSQLADDEQIRTAILASSRLPWLAGPPVSFRGRRLLDPTLSSAIPIDAPRRTATDMLVLQTRPHGVVHSPLSGPVSRLTVGYLAKLNPALVPLLATRSERYDRLTAELAAAAADPTSAPAVCVIRPPAHVPRIGQMENRAGPLTRAGSYGLRAAWMALTGEDPDLVSAPRAYPPMPSPASDTSPLSEQFASRSVSSGPRSGFAERAEN
jgi:predicted patatin/cPLA2 family phospholipase